MVSQTIGIFFVLAGLISTVYAEENSVISPEPTPTPSRLISQPVTPTPAVIPTPAAVLVVIDSPDVIVAGETIVLPIFVENATSSAAYSIKLLIKDGETVVNKTHSPSAKEWIAWNASWSKFPILETEEGGEGSLDIETSIPALHTSCECTLTVRMRSADGKNKDYELGMVFVEPGEEEVVDVENSEEDEEDVADEEEEGLQQELIVDIRSLSKGTTVQAEGVVTSSLNELGKNTIYIEDETGGIKVVFKGVQGELKHGYRILVRGTMQEAYNEHYLKVDNWQDASVLGEESLPDPLTVKTGKVDEVVEGKLVTVNGQVSATSGNTFFINDGSGDAKVYIKSSTSIQKPRMRTGYYAAVTGVVSQYKDDYRVLPRFQHDVIVSTQPIDPATLGALSVLPETGISESKHVWYGVILVVVGLVARFVAALCLRGSQQRTSIP